MFGFKWFPGRGAMLSLQDLDPELEDVRAAHLKFGILSFDEPGHLTQRKLRERIDFLREEVNEFEEAAMHQDMEQMVDALVDIVYVAKGTAVMLGLRNLWRAAWREVQRANMSKVRGVGKRGHAVDLVKPYDWVPPNHPLVLMRHGYDPLCWGDELAVDDDLCRDDPEPDPVSGAGGIS